MLDKLHCSTNFYFFPILQTSETRTFSYNFLNYAGSCKPFFLQCYSMPACNDRAHLAVSLDRMAGKQPLMLSTTATAACVVKRFVFLLESEHNFLVFLDALLSKNACSIACYS